MSIKSAYYPFSTPSLPVLFNIGIPVAFSPNVFNGNCEFIGINVALGNALNAMETSLQDAKETVRNQFFYREIIPTEYNLSLQFDNYLSLIAR